MYPNELSEHITPSQIYKREDKHRLLPPVGMCVNTFIIKINTLCLELLKYKDISNAEITTGKLVSLRRRKMLNYSAALYPATELEATF